MKIPAEIILNPDMEGGYNIVLKYADQTRKELRLSARHEMRWMEIADMLDYYIDPKNKYFESEAPLQTSCGHPLPALGGEHCIVPGCYGKKL